MEFSTLELDVNLKKGLEEAGYQNAMPVQEQVLQTAFSGRDLYVQSQTGTGKTAAYLIVIMQRILSEPLLANKKALIMVPTRELAVQVETEAKLIGKYLDFKIGSFYGGVGYGNQTNMLRDDVQILTGTPGRVLDLNASGHMNLMDIAFLVLDEADRMFDMGFYPDLRKLIKVVPPVQRRQTMLFSATLNNYVKNLAWEYTKEPVEIEIAPENVTVDVINQVLYHVSSSNKMMLLLGILKREQPESAIIFCNTKRYTERVAKRLRENGIKCEYISGDLRQNQRLIIIDKFKAGKINFLVATDVAARGIDIEDLSLVVNFDLPNETENYVHRIGRTARAGKSGKAISFASEQDVYEIKNIEKYIGKKIPATVAEADLYSEDVSHAGTVDSSKRVNKRVEGGKRGGGKRHRQSNDRAVREGAEVGSAKRDDARRSGGGKNRPGKAGTGGQGGRNKNFRRGGKSFSGNDAAVEDAVGGGAAPELEGLTFEQRMVVYKNKYSRGGGKGSVGKDSVGKGNQPHGAGGEQAYKKKKHGNAGAASSANNQGQSTNETPKKGILKNIFKIFKGKKK
ncbi:MAG: DEAD/DEAH box helicase [Termitinemataceae bacterium]|nr:MAG: DEAD/DEAH box helicase [Termitinemataceae bacterium]